LSRRDERTKFGYLKHPAFLTRHVIDRLCLVDVHHSQRSAIGHAAAGGAEVGLNRTLKGNVWRFWLLALFPAKELLAADQGDHQRNDGKQGLLQMQWRETQLSGTLTIHPESPPTLGLIWLRAMDMPCVVQVIAAVVPAFFKKKHV
jgi:hypothetical protein